jgi:cold shock CspA family protein
MADRDGRTATLERHADDSGVGRHKTIVCGNGARVMVEGVIVKFIPERGFGFVRFRRQSDGAATEIFFHQDTVLDEELPPVGSNVSFEVQANGTRLRAINVRRIAAGNQERAW